MKFGAFSSKNQSGTTKTNDGPFSYVVVYRIHVDSHLFNNDNAIEYNFLATIFNSHRNYTQDPNSTNIQLNTQVQRTNGKNAMNSVTVSQSMKTRNPSESARVLHKP